MLDLMVLMEEFGRGLVTEPYLPNIVICGAFLSRASESQRAEHLPMLITGDILAVLYYRQHAQWGQLFKLVPGVAAGMLAGAVFLGRLDNESMRIFLGVFDRHYGRLWNDGRQFGRPHHGNLFNHDGP